MRNQTARLWSALALSLGLSGCTGAVDGEGVGYVLLDREAREAGISLLVDGASRERVLPERVGTGASLALLVPGEEPLPLALDAEDFVYVSGTGGEVSWLSPETGLALDEVSVAGDTEAIRALTEALDAERTSEEGEPMVHLRATDILRALAEETTPAGLLEIRPIVTREGTLGEDDARAFGTRAAPEVNAVRAGEVVHANPLIDLSPLGCADRATGTWVSRQYYPTHGGYYEFTLEVREQGESGALSGEIRSHFWRGTDEEKPSFCAPGGEEWVVTMPAKGRFEDGHLVFGGTSWSVDEARCGMPPVPGSYLLDQFSADTHTNEDTLSTVNSDGGLLINHHTPFERISC